MFDLAVPCFFGCFYCTGYTKLFDCFLCCLCTPASCVCHSSSLLNSMKQSGRVPHEDEDVIHVCMKHVYFSSRLFQTLVSKCDGGSSSFRCTLFVASMPINTQQKNHETIFVDSFFPSLLSTFVHSKHHYICDC